MSAPERLPPLVPYLTVRDGEAALRFYTTAFLAEILQITPFDGGSGISHTRFLVNGALVMLCEESDWTPAGGGAPSRVGGSPVTLHLVLGTPREVDALYARGIAAGAASVNPPMGSALGAVCAHTRPGGALLGYGCAPGIGRVC